jgi:hypothetical protein
MEKSVRRRKGVCRASFRMSTRDFGHIPDLCEPDRRNGDQMFETNVERNGQTLLCVWDDPQHL